MIHHYAQVVFQDIAAAIPNDEGVRRNACKNLKGREIEAKASAYYSPRLQTDAREAMKVTQTQTTERQKADRSET